MLYVYGITEAPDEPAIPGLHGARVRAIGRQTPFAMASEHPEAPSHPDEADLWAHERVVEDLMNRCTVLPMRFGSTIADESSLVAMLDARRGEFESLIENLQGAVELSVRAQLPPTPHPRSAAGPGSGGAGSIYMRRRRAAQRAVDDALARIHEPLARLARDSARRPAGLRREAFKAAYLVDLERVDEFQTQIERLATEIGDARIACTGPWPPYSFSSGESA